MFSLLTLNMTFSLAIFSASPIFSNLLLFFHKLSTLGPFSFYTKAISFCLFVGLVWPSVDFATWYCNTADAPALLKLDYTLYFYKFIKFSIFYSIINFVYDGETHPLKPVNMKFISLSIVM